MRSARLGILALLLATSALARHRAAAPPPGPSILVPAFGATHVSVFNEDAIPASVTICQVACASAVLAPGTTTTYPLSAIGGPGVVSVSTTTPKLDVRSDTLDGIALNALTVRQVVPVFDLTMYDEVVHLFTLQQGIIDVALLGQNGVQEDVHPITVRPGFTDVSLATFNVAMRKQLELRPTFPVGGIAELTNKTTKKSVFVWFLPEFTTTTSVHFLGIDPSTTLATKNPDPSHILGTNIEYWQAERDNTNVHQFTTDQIINFGMNVDANPVVRAGGTMPGAISLGGAGNPDGTFELLTGWAITNDRYQPELAQTASSRQGDNADQRTRYKLVVSGVTNTDTITLLNMSDAYNFTITGTIAGYDSSGNRITSTPITLRARENTAKLLSDVAPSAARIELALDNAPVGTYAVPMAVMSVTSATGFTHVPARLIRKNTGEEVVERMLDYLHDYGGGFFLPYDLMRCVHVGGCGVAPIGEQLATIYARNDHTSDPWTADRYLAYLRTISNGITTTDDPEMWMQHNPFSWSNRGQPNVQYLITTSQATFASQPGTVPLSLTDAETVWQLLRAFVIKYLDTNPELACGTKDTGPSLDPKCPAYDFAYRSTP